MPRAATRRPTRRGSAASTRTRTTTTSRPGAEPNLLILDTARRRVEVRGRVHLGLGGALLPGDPTVLPVGRKQFEFALDKRIRCKDQRRTRCEFGQRPARDLEAADVELWGFAVAGTVKASWSTEGNGGATLELAPSIDGILRPLVSRLFKTKDPTIEPAGSGGSLVKAGLKVESTNDKGFQLGLSELTISPFKLVDKPRGGSGKVTARWTSPVGISARGERKAYGDATGNLWTFEVIVGFPNGEGLRVKGKRAQGVDRGAAGRVYVFDGQLSGGGAEVSGLNMPIGSSPVFLQRVALDVLVRPGFGVRGEVGLSGGPKLLDDALVEGDPVAIGVGTLAKCESAASPDDLPFELSGKVTMPAAQKAGADHELNLKVCDILGDNALEGEFGAKFLWIGGELGVQGALKGWVDDSKFNIDGDGQIILPGLPDPQGSIVVSSVGIGGCGGASFFKGGVGLPLG